MSSIYSKYWFSQKDQTKGLEESTKTLFLNTIVINSHEYSLSVSSCITSAKVGGSVVGLLLSASSYDGNKKWSVASKGDPPPYWSDPSALSCSMRRIRRKRRLRWNATISTISSRNPNTAAAEAVTIVIVFISLFRWSFEFCAISK